MRSGTCTKVANLSLSHYPKETRISNKCHTLKVAMITLWQAVIAFPLSRTVLPNSEFKLRSSLHCPGWAMHWSIQVIRPAPHFVSFSTAIRCGSPCNLTTALLWKTTFQSLHLFLSRYCTPWLMFGFNKCMLFSSLTFTFSGKGDITKSNTVCNGSNQNDAGRFISVSTSVGIFKAPANPSSNLYRRLNNAAPFLTKYAVQLPCLLLSSANAASF